MSRLGRASRDAFQPIFLSHLTVVDGSYQSSDTLLTRLLRSFCQVKRLICCEVMILILFIIVHSLSIFGSHTVNVWVLLESICRLFCDVWHNYERLRWLVCPCLILSSILHEFIFRNRFDCSLLASAFRASYNSSGWLIFLLWVLSFSFVRPRAWCGLWAIGLGGYRKLDDTCFVLGRGLWCLIGILVGDNNKWLYSHSVRGYTAFMLTVWQGLWVLLRRILRY